MKYKVGDKFLQEVEIKHIHKDSSAQFPYRVESNGSYCSEKELDKMRRPDDMTAEEAWEIARKLCNMEGDERMVILGNKYYHMAEVYEDFTPQQAKIKIEAWEAAKEIKVGDVVEAEGGIKAVVMDIQRQTFGVFTENGCIEEWYKSKVVKTRHHIDIDGLLKQVRGNKR